MNTYGSYEDLISLLLQVQDILNELPEEAQGVLMTFHVITQCLALQNNEAMEAMQDFPPQVHHPLVHRPGCHHCHWPSQGHCTPT